MKFEIEKYDFLNTHFQFEHAIYLVLVLIGSLLLIDVLILIFKLIQYFVHRKKYRESINASPLSDHHKVESNHKSGKLKKLYDSLRVKISSNRFFRPIGRLLKRVAIFIWRFKILILHILVIIVSAWILYILFAPNPKFVKLVPQRDEVWSNFERQIEITFDRPVNVDRMTINMNPEVEGEWEYEYIWPNLPLSRKLVFKPKESFMPDQKIQLYFAGYINYLETNKEEEHLIEFYSIPLPELESTAPKNKTEDFGIDEDIVLSLTSQSGPFVGWRIETSPHFETEIIENDLQQLSIHPKEPLKQGKKYVLTVYRFPQTFNTQTKEIIQKGEETKFVSLQFVTVKAPLIAELHPTGTSVNPNDPVKIIFDAPMDKSSVEESFSISPEIEGSFEWTDNVTFVFTPKNGFAKDMQYTVILKKEVRSIAGGIAEAEVTYNFKTAGRVNVISYYPIHLSQGVPVNSGINVTFDQAVDHASAQAAFSISPSIAGGFSWQENTMVFSPSSSYSYGTTYTVTLQGGIKTVYGLDSTQIFTLSFTTGSQTFRLPVALFSQQHNFSCNIAATRMVVNYINGYDVGEDQIYNSIPHQTVPFDSVNNVWGDPNQGYVGDWDGNPNGYGVYWNPISNYLSSQGISNQVYRYWNVPELAQQVQNGNPVIVWWQNGWSTPTDISWTTPEGQPIKAVNGMHSEVVVGFIGPVDNPTHLIVNDTFRGQRILERGYFEGLWGYFDRTAIVAYK